MAIDRVVRWKKRKPTPEEVQFVIEDFFNGQAKITKTDRYFITLPGHCKGPLVRVSETAARHDHSKPHERWIEVWEDKGRTCLYVMTRLQDEYVNSIAAGLIEVFRRFWQGELDPM